MKSLVHIHIPKCAGMALRAVLEQVYGEAFIGLPICRNTQEAAAELVRATRALPVGIKAAEAAAISGHAPYGYATLYDGGQHVALLRSPSSRLVSWYRMEDRGEPFETILRRGTYAGRTLDNLQVRYLAGLRLDAEAPPVGERDLERAFENAQQMIVGGVRELGYVVQRVALACQWEKAVSIPHVNLGPDTVSPSPHYSVTDEVFHLLEPLVSWDRALIRYRLGLGGEV